VRRGIPMLPLLAALSLSAMVLLWPSDARSLIASHPNCNFCHSMHGAPGFALLNNAQVEVLCLTCHGPGGISVKKADVHSNRTPRSSYPAFRFTCRQCHDAHDNVASWTSGTNIRLIGPLREAVTGYATITTPNSGVRYVVFQSLGTGTGQPSLHSYADSDEDGNGYYDGVCETCHLLTRHHRNNAPDTRHHTGDTCTRCHAHVDRFMR
jgi:predicted CXXCH cytochrome family protein